MNPVVGVACAQAGSSSRPSRVRDWASRTARTSPDGEVIVLESQDRSLWDRSLIAQGVALVERALGSRRFGPYSLQAAISAVHAEAPSAAATDWAQIVALYDVMLGIDPSPVIGLNRAVALGEADGPRAGLAALAALDDSLPRHDAVAAYLHERDGDLATAARLYAEAAHKAPNLAERDHLTRQAARLNAG